MYLHLGEWLATSQVLTNAAKLTHAHGHELTGTLTRVSLTAAASGIGQATGPDAQPFDWSRPPVTRARVFAERLTDVRPVCVVGASNDRENCLLDLPPGGHIDVSASHLMLAGCEASLPSPLRAALTKGGRNASALEQTFSDLRAAEAHGQFSVPALERRLAGRLRELSPAVRHLLRGSDVYIEVPQLTFQRLITSVPEARRNGIRAPFPDPNLSLPSGSPDIRDAMLGAYIRIPVDDKTYTMLVSLASPLTIEPIRQDSLAHARAHRHQMFGDVPEHLETAGLRMRALPPGENLVRTLAEHLHDGHYRYREFAYGASRETLAATSHAHVRQQLCRPFMPVRSPDAASASLPTQTMPLPPAAPSTPAEDASSPSPSVPHRRRSRQDQLSMTDLEKALAELERLDKLYTQQARPRFG